MVEPALAPRRGVPGRSSPGFVALALLSRTVLGQLGRPLADGGVRDAGVRERSRSLASVFAMMGIYRMGCTMTRGYERAALELAERREELCSDGEDRTRALEGMAARLAHEVKNPLAAIKGLSTHMARNAADPKTAERLAIVAAEADRLQAIVEGFLSFSRGLDDLERRADASRTRSRASSRVLLETRAEEAGVTHRGRRRRRRSSSTPTRASCARRCSTSCSTPSRRRRAARRCSVGVARDCEGARITVRDDGVGHDARGARAHPQAVLHDEGGRHGPRRRGRARPRRAARRPPRVSRACPGTGTTVTIALPMKAKPCERLPNPLRDRRRPEPSRPRAGAR